MINPQGAPEKSKVKLIDPHHDAKSFRKDDICSINYWDGCCVNVTNLTRSVPHGATLNRSRFEVLTGLK